jgi:nitronate monooxygenase
MKTRITEMFGVETPIVMGGMTGVGYGELVAAVANAGALGFITAHMFPSGEALLAEIEKTKALTSKPFGINLTLLPSINPIPYDDYREAIIASGIKIVETAGRAPVDHLPRFKEAGVKVIHKCTSVRHSVSAVRHGVDVISKEKSVELADRAFNQLVQSSCDDFCGFEKPCFQGCGKFSFHWTHILSHQAIFWRIVRLI